MPVKKSQARLIPLQTLKLAQEPTCVVRLNRDGWVISLEHSDDYPVFHDRNLLIGTSLAKWMTPEDYKYCLENIHLCIDTQKPVRVESRFFHDNSYYYRTSRMLPDGNDVVVYQSFQDNHLESGQKKGGGNLK